MPVEMRKMKNTVELVHQSRISYKLNFSKEQSIPVSTHSLHNSQMSGTNHVRFCTLSHITCKRKHNDSK